MVLYFITGNKGKFEDTKLLLPIIEQLDIDLPEIQELDAKKVLEVKIKEGFRYKKGEFIIEDSSLSFNCLNGLPGTLIKWFYKSLGNTGLYNIVKKLGDDQAEAKVTIAYAKNKDKINYFEGSIGGRIVSPRGNNGFGWDPIFKPEGLQKTFAEMTSDQKNSISMRRIAINKLKKFLGGKTA